MREVTLVALTRTPLLGAADLALLCGLTERGARRALEARVLTGEASSVTHSANRRHLYYLTTKGVIAAAQVLGMEPERLAARYGLSERSLLRRLPALDRLIASRRVLLRLAVTLDGAGGAVEEWQAYPLPWSFRRAGHLETLLLDGEVTLRFPDGSRRTVGYLWDGDDVVSAAALATRLERLAECRASSLSHGTCLPPVLLVTAHERRVPGGYHPDLLWTTTEALAASDPLTAAWCGRHGSGGGDRATDLWSALLRLQPRLSFQTPRREERLVILSGLASPTTLQRRIDRLHADPISDPVVLDLVTLPLVLPPRVWPLLTVVGQHPLLDRHDLATVLRRDPFDTWAVLRLLCRHGLCQSWRPQAGRRAWRYSLTTRGTTLLAGATGLPPLTYRRVYGVLDDARRPGEHGLSYAHTNLAHTDGINAVYLAFLRAARLRGGTLRWRGEWACARTFYHANDHEHERRSMLCPDAELHYEGPDGPLHAFVEYDRHTEPAHQLTAKIDRYYAYRAYSGDDGFAVLLVTDGPGRGEQPLERARALARAQRIRPLPLRVATLAALSAHGPWASIWQNA